MSLEASARCAQHPTATAAILCVRCGDYACGECSVAGSSYCARCQPADPEHLRRRHLRYEAWVRAVATSYSIVGVCTGLFVALAACDDRYFEVALVVELGDLRFDLARGTHGPILAAAGGVLFAVVGRRLRELSRFSYFAGMALGLVGAISFALLSRWLVAALFLAATLPFALPRGAVVFGAPYRAAIAATPQLDAAAARPGRVIWWLFAVALFAQVVDLIMEMIAAG